MLTKQQKQILDLLKEQGAMTGKQISLALEQHPKTVANRLGYLARKGCIKVSQQVNQNNGKRNLYEFVHSNVKKEKLKNRPNNFKHKLSALEIENAKTTAVYANKDTIFDAALWRFNHATNPRLQKTKRGR